MAQTTFYIDIIRSILLLWEKIVFLKIIAKGIILSLLKKIMLRIIASDSGPSIISVLRYVISLDNRNPFMYNSDVYN